MGLLKRLFLKGDGEAIHAPSALSGTPDAPCDRALIERDAPNISAEADRLLASGNPEGALKAYQAALDLTDDHAPAHLGQGRAYLALGHTQDACDSLEIALAIDPDCVPALQLLGKLRSEASCAGEGLELLDRAVAIAPERADLHCERGLALNRAGRSEDAAQAYRRAIALDPTNPAPRINLGLICLQQFGDPIAAEAHFLDALKLQPYHVAAMANLGLALQEQCRVAQAIELYREGLRQHPGHVELRWNEGIAHLSLGDFARGWPGYEMRLKRADGRKLDRFPYPEWDGGTLQNAGLLVLGEQGVGDEIMFASCLPDLCAAIGLVVLECAPRLEKLFARSFGGIAVHGKERNAPTDWLRQYPHLKSKVAIGSLAQHLRGSRDAFPSHRGYLQADPERVAELRHRSRAMGSGGDLTVGVSWRGGTPGTRGALRSVAFEQLQPLLAVPNTRFFSLQHSIRPDEREEARAAGMVVWDLSEDLGDTAALICALDLTITVANTNAHLAGALGRPAWVLLNQAPDWRWLQAGERSPWYPSLQLYRCVGTPPGSAVIEAAARRLAALADARRANLN